MKVPAPATELQARTRRDRKSNILKAYNIIYPQRT